MNSLSLFSFVRKPLILMEDITKRVLDNIKNRLKVPNPNPDGSREYNNNIPKTEEELTKILQHFETLSPDIKNPEYIQFLAQTAFDRSPSWVINEDEGAIIGLLKEYNALLKSKKLNPPENQLSYFKTVPALRQMLQSRIQQINTDYAGVAEHEKPEITVAKIIETYDDWTVLKIPQGSDPATLRAAYLLCSNKRHGTSLCVGWEDGKSAAANYLPKGDFYLLQKNNVSVYAVSTTQNVSLILWNRADSILINTDDYSRSGDNRRSVDYTNLLPALEKVIVPLGSTSNEFFSSLSHVPEEIRPLILKLQSNPDSTIFNLIPKKLLNDTTEQDKQFIFKVLHRVNKPELIENLNNTMTSGSNETILLSLYALLTYITTPYRGITFTAEELYKFNWYPFLAYIEAHANSNDRNMSKEIHDALMLVINNGG